MMKILPDVYGILNNGHNCNVFIINSENESILVDTGLGSYANKWGMNQSLNIDYIIEKFGISKILLTHYHIDHIGGILDFENPKFEIYSSEIEAPIMEKGDGKYIDPVMNVDAKPIKITHKLKNNDSLEIGNFNFRVIITPGHTLGSVCLFEENKGILISGDTVFPDGSFGRVDFHGSNSNDLINSLEKIKELDVEYLLAGHMDPMTNNVKQSLIHSYNNARMMF